MFYRLERLIEPCKGLGYTAYTRQLTVNRDLHACLDWDTLVGNPLQRLECPIAWKFHTKLVPATWKHPRPAHFRDPLLRETTVNYINKGEHQHLIFGCESLEKLNIWFPEPIRKIMIEQYGFGLKRYTAKLVWHGLRQSMLDNRTVKNVYDVY